MSVSIARAAGWERISKTGTLLLPEPLNGDEFGVLAASKSLFYSFAVATHSITRAESAARHFSGPPSRRGFF